MASYTILIGLLLDLLLSLWLEGLVMTHRFWLYWVWMRLLLWKGLLLSKWLLLCWKLLRIKWLETLRVSGLLHWLLFKRLRLAQQPLIPLFNLCILVVSLCLSRQRRRRLRLLLQLTHPLLHVLAPAGRFRRHVPPRPTLQERAAAVADHEAQQPEAHEDARDAHEPEVHRPGHDLGRAVDAVAEGDDHEDEEPEDHGAGKEEEGAVGDELVWVFVCHLGGWSWTLVMRGGFREDRETVRLECRAVIWMICRASEEIEQIPAIISFKCRRSKGTWRANSF